MDRLNELDERVTTLESRQRMHVIATDCTSETFLTFTSSSYYVDVEIDVMSTSQVTVDVMLNGVTHHYEGNYVTDTYRTATSNTLVVKVSQGGLLSKKIKLEGTGVKLLTI